jgi:RimJ/RimL family protein N-acetyltransferase
VIELRPFIDADARPMLDWIATEADLVLWSGTALSWPPDAAQFTVRATAPGRLSWTAVDPDAGTAVGHVSLSVDAVHRAGRIGGVLIAPTARGRGLGGLLVDAALDVTFGELDLHRVGLGVSATTPRHSGSASGWDSCARAWSATSRA